MRVMRVDEQNQHESGVGQCSKRTYRNQLGLYNNPAACGLERSAPEYRFACKTIRSKKKDNFLQGFCCVAPYTPNTPYTPHTPNSLGQKR